jgi:hypothetical protein
MTRQFIIAGSFLYLVLNQRGKLSFRYTTDVF